MKRNTLMALLFLAAAAGLGWWWWAQNEPDGGPAFRERAAPEDQARGPRKEIFPASTNPKAVAQNQTEGAETTAAGATAPGGSSPAAPKPSAKPGNRAGMVLDGIGPVEILDSRVEKDPDGNEQVLSLVKAPGKYPYLRVIRAGPRAPATIMAADHVLAQFDPGLGIARIRETVEAAGYRVRKEFRQAGLVALESAAADPALDFVPESIKTIAGKVGGVRIVEPDYMVFADGDRNSRGQSLEYTPPGRPAVWDAEAAINSSLVTPPDAVIPRLANGAAAWPREPEIAPASLRRITFDPPNFLGGEDVYRPYMEEQNIRITETSYGVILNTGASFGPRNGTIRLQLKIGGEIRHSQGLPFTLHQMDIAEGGFNRANTFTFEGEKSDGSTVSETFTTDGVNDDGGPAVDFEVHTFPATFTDLVSVTLTASAPGFTAFIDNIEVTVHGQETPAPEPPEPPKIYDMTFDPPIHQPDEWIALGGPYTPKTIIFGAPYVRANIFGMENAVELRTGDGGFVGSATYEQFDIALNQAAEHYRVELDFYMKAVGPDEITGGLALHFDGNGAQYLQIGGGNLVTWAANTRTTIGTFQLETVNHISIDIDMDQGSWDIYLNENLILENGTFTATSDITGMRVNFSNGTEEDAIAAIDNIEIWAFGAGGIGNPVGPTIEVVPESRNFGSLGLDEVRDRSLRINNPGDQTLSISGISSDHPAFRSYTPLPITIPARTYQEIRVRYEPESAGIHSGELTIRNNSDNDSRKTVPLTGFGYAGQPLILSQESFNLLVEPEQGRSVMLRLENEGDDPISWTIASDNGAIGSGIFELPSDPSLDDLWGLQDPGDYGGGIAATEAWKLTTGSASVVAAVIDTGIDYEHIDLEDNIWINPGEIPDNGQDDDGNGYVDDYRGWDFYNGDSDPMDGNWHGTHVSGTIAAKGGNSYGMVGVSWHTTLMAVKFLSDFGTGWTSDAIGAIDYATDNGAHLSNNSWGGGGNSTLLYAAIQRARDADCLFVAAAGNSRADTDVTPNYPSSYDLDNIISVASTTVSDNLSGFSNYGLTSVDLGAPGSNIKSTRPGNGFTYLSGTSMASPHVAGTAALLLAQDPSLGYAEVKQRILDNVDPNFRLNGITVSGGRLNALKALQAGGGAAWLNLSPLSGTLNPGETHNVSVSVDATGLPEGEYSQMLRLSSNDPIRPEIAIPVTLGVRPILAPPTRPTNVTATDDTLLGEVGITWNASANAVTYEVWRNTINETASATLLASDLTETQFFDDTGVPGTIYIYWVRAVNPLGTSGFSFSDTGSPREGPRILTQPESHTISPGDEVTLTVSAVPQSGGGGSVSYEWFRGGEGDTSNPVGTDSSQFVVSDLLLDTSFWVRITDGTGSGASRVSMIKTIPEAVQVIDATNGLFTLKSRISWSPVEGAVEYNLYRSPTPDFADSTLLATGPDRLYNDFFINAGVPFYYFVTAVDGDGDEGPYQANPEHLNEGLRTTGVMDGVRIPIRRTNDFVFDSQGFFLYITSAGGVVDRYRMIHKFVDQEYAVGGDPQGIDISPDDTIVLAANAEADSNGRARIHRILPGLESMTTHDFAESTMDGPSPAELGAWDVSIFSNSRALVTHADFSQGGPEPLREYNPQTGVFQVRTVNGVAEIGDRSFLAGNPARNRGALADPAGAGGSPQWFAYHPAPDTFTGGFDPVNSPRWTAMSRDGQLIAVTADAGAANVTRVYSLGGALVHQVTIPGKGVEFSPILDELLVVDYEAGRVRTYDTATWQEKFSFPLSGPLPRTGNDTGRIAVSPEGWRIAVSTAEAIELFVDPLSEPTIPLNLTATTSLNDRIDLAWDLGNSASSSSVYRNSIDDSATATLMADSINGLSWTDTAVDPGEVWYYWIKGENLRGEGPFSDAVPGMRAIDPPGSITASDGAFEDRVEVGWAAGHPALTWELFRNTADDPNSATLLTTTSGTSFDDTTAIPGQTNFYWVRGRNGSETGPFSVPDTGFGIVPVPSGVTALNLDSGVQVDWAPVTGTGQYRINRGVLSNPDLSQEIATVSTGETYLDASVAAGIRYYYFVRAVVTNNLGLPSAGMQGKRLHPAPGFVVATDGFYDDKVRVRWDEVTGAREYRVFRNTTADASGAVEVGRLDVAETREFDDANATPGTRYFYSVRAEMSNGQEAAFGAWSQGERSALITFRPDEMIGKNAASMIGDEIYNTNGSRQTARVRSKRRKSLKFYLELQNDGVVADRLNVTGTRGNRLFRAAYFSVPAGGGRLNVTSGLRTGLYQVALGPGEHADLQLEVKRKGRKNGRLKRKIFSVIGASENAPDRRDAVKGKAESG